MARLQFVKVGPIFRVPWVTLRDETEWVETAESGRNVLAGCDPQHIVEAVRTMRPLSGSAAPYGDGQAAERIVNSIS